MTRADGQVRADPMAALLVDKKITARLPLIGPLIGWTRPIGGKLHARLWIQADGTEDEPPAFALTAFWDREKRQVCPGSARAWKLTKGRPRDMNPPMWLYFAVATVDFAPGQEHCVVRMISVHGKNGAEIRRQSKPHAYELVATESAGEPAITVQTLPELSAESGLPEPTLAVVEDIFPGLKIDYDRLAEKSFADIERRLKKVAENVRQPIRATGSRRALTPRFMAECEADLAPCARGQLASKDGILGFAATCCRHPGVGLDAERAGRSYRRLEAASARADGPAFALLTGDQIYADATAGVFEVTDRFEKFSLRYEEAFRSPHFRRCAARLPLYMVADDHEIEDNWSRSRLEEPWVPAEEKDLRKRDAAWAQMLFIAYQRLHGPLSPVLSRGWYEFEAAGVPFFVMDTRFERYAWGGTTAQRICSQTQFDALLEWLARLEKLDAEGNLLSGVPKFIVSGSVFAPGLAEFVRDPLSARRADNWQAFHRERAMLVDAVVKRKLRNVVFLSGDYHCGAVAALELCERGASGETHVPAYAIVSPPAYAPFPFANVRVCEVADTELVVGPAGTPPARARIRAEAWEGGGYVLIRVGRQDVNWFVDVDFCDPATGRRLDRRLSRGQILPR
jgi:hypothetical protein